MAEKASVNSIIRRQSMALMINNHKHQFGRVEKEKLRQGWKMSADIS